MKTVEEVPAVTHLSMAEITKNFSDNIMGKNNNALTLKDWRKNNLGAVETETLVKKEGEEGDGKMVKVKGVGFNNSAFFKSLPPPPKPVEEENTDANDGQEE